MYFFIRIITVAGYFALLGKANVWLNPIANTLLALGYRGFLIASPFLSKYTKHHAISVCLLICSVGLLFCFFEHPGFAIFGAFLFSLGISVSNFLIKSETAHTHKGAAYNKISANIGSFIAGLILLCAFISKAHFFALEITAFLVVMILSYSFSIKKIPALPLPKVFNLNETIKWALFGIATGIKLFAIFAVMPQYLLVHLGHLPFWYGAMIFINSLAVVFLQLPIIHAISCFKLKNRIKVTVLLMLIGMVIIASPQAFHVQSFIGACLWTFLLAVIECVASYLDIVSAKSGYLLNKEMNTGIGGGLTVLLSRYLPIHDGAVVIAVVGILCLGYAYLLGRGEG